MKLVLRDGDESADVNELTVGKLPSSGIAAPLAVDVFVVESLNVACTVKVYDVPFVKPDIVQLVVDVVQVKPPGFEVAV